MLLKAHEGGSLFSLKNYFAQIFLALIFFDGCELFGEKKNKDLAPEQLQQSKAYIAANPNGPAGGGDSSQRLKALPAVHTNSI